MSRSRAICFTINNYSLNEVKRLKESFKDLKYGIFQFERGSNGTKHIQGYAYSKNARTLKGWKEVVGSRAHVEVARGTTEENRKYCSKEETRDSGAFEDPGIIELFGPESKPYEFGMEPKQGSRTDLAELAKSAADSSVPLEELLQRFPDGYLKFYKGVSAIRSIVTGKRDWKSQVIWLYGPTGTGKSRIANAIADAAYWKPGSNKWWDGYQSHEDVIIDDYRRDLCTFSELLRLFDRYPYMVEAKGISFQMVAKRIIVTTPKDPQSTWEGRTEEDIAQLLRRIDVVVRFTDINFYFEKGRTDDLEQVIGSEYENFK
jgi:hypothetical protein